MKDNSECPNFKICEAYKEDCNRWDIFRWKCLTEKEWVEQYCKGDLKCRHYTKCPFGRPDKGRAFSCGAWIIEEKIGKSWRELFCSANYSMCRHLEYRLVVGFVAGLVQQIINRKEGISK